MSILFFLISNFVVFFLIIFNRFLNLSYFLYLFVLIIILYPLDLYILNFFPSIKEIFDNKIIFIIYTFSKLFTFIILYQLPSRAITSALLFNIKNSSKKKMILKKYNSYFILNPRFQNFEDKGFIKINKNKIILQKKGKLLGLLITNFRKYYNINLYNN